MKGATGELCVKTMRAPNKNSTRIIGVSHHFFLTFRKVQNSLMIEPLLIVSPC
jgi:hypothetical protein